MRTVAADAVFRALADPTRRQILELLRRGPWPVREIAERFPMSRPAVSKHLRLLREAGLVVEERRGRERLYCLTDEGLAPASGWLELMATGVAVERGDGDAPAPGDRRAMRGKTARGRGTARQAERQVKAEEWRSW